MVIRKKEMAEIEKQLQKITEENRRILQRLNDVLGEEVNTCRDCRGRVNQSELRDLGQRVADLEERDRKRQDEVDLLKREIEQSKKERDHFLHSMNEQKTFLEISRFNQPANHHLMKSESAAGSCRERLVREARRQNNPTVKPSYTKSDQSEADVREANYKHTISDQASSERVERDQASSDQAGKDGGASTQKTNTSQNLRNKESSASANKSSKPADTKQSHKKDVEVNKASGQSFSAEARKIQKPNFLLKPDTKRKERELPARNYSKPLVIREEDKRYVPVSRWWDICRFEGFQGSNSEVQFLDGVHTILCVDISESMEDCWTQVQKFVYDYLDGLKKLVEEEKFNEENVALVTFGHETRAHVRFTKDLPEIRRTFEGITLGGPSPLFGGIMAAIGVAESNDKKCIVKGAEVHKRIVLISDGHFTETELSHGPDKVDTNTYKQDESMAHLIDIVERLPPSGKELICVPVGEANELLHKQLEIAACGKRFSYTEGTKLARRFYLRTKGSSLLPSLEEIGNSMSGLGAVSLPNIKIELGGLLGTMDLSDLSTEDQENIQEIIEDHKKLTMESIRRMSIDERENKVYEESDSEVLPKIGSRVRRGPDWDWEIQDGYGPGTVIGHNKNDLRVWVHWDANGHRNIYCYGSAGRYDILPVDEPRIVGLNDDIKVGCVVQPGDGWQYDFRNVKQGEEGVVIRVPRPRKVQVRWESGYRGEYSSSTTSPSELKIAPKCIRDQSQRNYVQRRNKNKNARQ